MKTKTALIFFLFSLSLFSQTRGIVKDGAGNPIPYVSITVEDEKDGTSSEEDGRFSITIDATKNLIFSAVGFETKIIRAAEAKNVVLQKKEIELNEVIISSAKKQKQKEIGSFGRGGIRYYSQQTTAKYFAYSDEAKNYPFLKEIIIYTSSKIENAKVNLRLLNVNPDGSPGEDILEDNHIVEVKKGSKNTTVNMEKNNIEIPSNGFFVVVEHLKINENKFHKKGAQYKDITGNKKRMDVETFEPFFGFLPSDENTCWYFEGKWTQRELHKIQNPKSYSNLLMRKYNDKYLEIAMSITITN
ncbi:carboxypeptidase-like regulatory domain-containing protein [Flavobacterium microcysteis]|uniref:Carboxypeptidase-like regulatory domain-containing protein n=1 Tax=Flavobacterium microcysteis TaxID=2596891 RepID=A0A501QII8_9FLAO|nr:carboxypeptidase-like regulatory domain-containing protein [Flavobacterium microcysteis]TPD71951.1 hypothetical protein FJA49_03455 [Flavobacterium microcysteis]